MPGTDDTMIKKKKEINIYILKKVLGLVIYKRVLREHW